MFDILLVVTLLILLSFVVSKNFSLKDDRVLTEAFDGNSYLVRDTPDRTETANTLARLNSMVNHFIDLLEKDFEAAKLPVVLRLKKRYRSGALSEGRISKALTSYTVNKGEKVVLCMRSRDENDTLFSDEILFSVLLHELAHIASITVDHGNEWRRNWHYLEDKAVQYKMLQHKKVDVDYCGIQLHAI